MLSPVNEDQVPLEAPLCGRHFRKYARRQIQLEIEADNARKPEEMPAPPTRIQPRRAAKDKYLESKRKAKKRKAEESLPSSKRSRTSEVDFDDSDSWTSFATSLNQMETRAINRARRRMSHSCPFGPVPWVCSVCVDETAKLSKEILPSASPAVAPIPDMSPVGEQLELHSQEAWNRGDKPMFRCGEMDCTIDACGEPMFMFLGRQLNACPPCMC